MAAAKPASRSARPEWSQDSPQVGARWGRALALVSLALGILLATVKIVIGFRTRSAALTSDGLESAGDVISSAIVFTGLSLASKPPDMEHPYGHGRYETLAGLAVGALLLLTGAGIFWHNLTNLNQSHPLSPIALYVLIVAAVLKCSLAASKFATATRIRSLAVKADAWHDLTDLLSTAVAAVSVGLALLNPQRFAQADRLGGLLIGLIITFLSISVVRHVVDQLLDTMPEPARMEEIRRAALSVPGALGIEKCWARRTGLSFHVDLHLEVDPNLTVRDSHAIAATVRSRVTEALPWVADVLVHVEPGAAETPSLHGKQTDRRIAV